MKHTTISKNKLPYQRGFSIMEILVATVMISLLVTSGIYYVNVSDKTGAVDTVTAKTAIVLRFPEAIMSIYARQQTLAGTSAQDLIDTGSVQTDNPVAWAVKSGDDAPTADTIGIDLTFDNNKEAQQMDTFLGDHLDTTLVSSTSLPENGKVLTVLYKID